MNELYQINRCLYGSFISACLYTPTTGTWCNYAPNPMSSIDQLEALLSNGKEISRHLACLSLWQETLQSSVSYLICRSLRWRGNNWCKNRFNTKSLSMFQVCCRERINIQDLAEHSWVLTSDMSHFYTGQTLTSLTRRRLIHLSPMNLECNQLSLVCGLQ